MAVLNNDGIRAGAAAAAAGGSGYQIKHSIQFDDETAGSWNGTNSGLYRHNADEGNRKTWTVSLWYKGALDVDGYSRLFSAGHNSSNFTILTWQGGALEIMDRYDGNNTVYQYTAGQCIDPTGWMHIVYRRDTTQATTANRSRIYVNGDECTWSNQNDQPAQDYQSSWGDHVRHIIGAGEGFGTPLEGHLADFYYCDGFSYGPDEFGELDDANVWQPKKFEGSFGTYGSHVDMADISDATTVGYDANSSGSGKMYSGTFQTPELYPDQYTDGKNGPQNVFDGDLTTWFNGHSGENIFDFREIGGISYTNGVELYMNSTSNGQYDSYSINFGTWTDVTGGGDGDHWGWVTAATGSGTLNTLRLRDSPNNSVSGAAEPTIRAIRINGDTILTDKTGNNWLPNRIWTKSVGTTDYLKGVTFDDCSGTFTLCRYYQLPNLFDGRLDTYIIERPDDRHFGDFNSMPTGVTRVYAYSPGGTLKYKRTGSNDWHSFSSNSRQWHTLNSGSSMQLTRLGAFGGGGGSEGYWYAIEVDGEIVTYIHPGRVNVTTDSPINGNPDDDTGVGGEISGNYAVMNPYSISQSFRGITVYEAGNRMRGGSTDSGQGACAATLGVLSGKFYCEWYIESHDELGGSDDTIILGATYIHQHPTSTLGDNLPGSFGSATNRKSFGYRSNGHLLGGWPGSSWGNTFTRGDVIGMALDMDNGAVYFSKNGTWQASGVPTSGSSRTNAAGTWTPGEYDRTDTRRQVEPLTPGVYIRDKTEVWFNSGSRPFRYAAPSGYKTWNTAHLPDFSSGDSKNNPNKFFDTVLYNGNETAKSITGLEFEPGLIWIKSRDTDQDHTIWDSVRGTGKFLESNTTEDEESQNGVTAFNSDGFSLGNHQCANKTDVKYIAYCWKTASSTTTGYQPTNADIAVDLRASAESGVSVVKAASPDNTQARGHGLDSAPMANFMKAYASNSEAWHVFHANRGKASYFKLNTNDDKADSDQFGTSDPNSTLFYVKANTGSGANYSSGMIYYLFANVEGFSRMGWYQGNADNNNNTYVYCGFRPKFIIIKAVESNRDWIMTDKIRVPYNGKCDYNLFANSDDDEAGLGPSDTGNQDSANKLDFLANGFRVRSPNAAIGSSNPFMFCAWADAPYKTSRAWFEGFN